MAGELAEVEGLGVWFPGEFRLRYSLEHPSSRTHLVVKFRKQRIFESHPYRICRPLAPVQPSETGEICQFLVFGFRFSVLVLGFSFRFAGNSREQTTNRNLELKTKNPKLTELTWRRWRLASGA